MYLNLAVRKYAMSIMDQDVEQEAKVVKLTRKHSQLGPEWDQ